MGQNRLPEGAVSSDFSISSYISPRTDHPLTQVVLTQECDDFVSIEVGLCYTMINGSSPHDFPPTENVILSL